MHIIREKKHSPNCSHFTARHLMMQCFIEYPQWIPLQYNKQNGRKLIVNKFPNSNSALSEIHTHTQGKAYFRWLLMLLPWQIKGLLLPPSNSPNLGHLHHTSYLRLLLMFLLFFLYLFL